MLANNNHTPQDANRRTLNDIINKQPSVHRKIAEQMIANGQFKREYLDMTIEELADLPVDSPMMRCEDCRMWIDTTTLDARCYEGTHYPLSAMSTLDALREFPAWYEKATLQWEVWIEYIDSRGFYHKELIGIKASKQQARECGANRQRTNLVTWANQGRMPLRYRWFMVPTKKRQLPKPDFPVNWSQYKAKYYPDTTPEFMAVLQQLSFDNYDDSLATVDSDWPAGAYVAPLDAEPDDTAPYAGKTVIAIGKQAPQAAEIVWTTPVIAEVKAWLASRKAEVDSVEKGEHKDHKQISGNYATQLNIQDFISAYRKLGGPKRYPQIIDELTAANPKSVRILHRNTPHTLKAMYDTVESMYKSQLATATKKAQAVKAATALGDNQCSCRRLPCRCGVAQDAA